MLCPGPARCSVHPACPGCRFKQSRREFVGVDWRRKWTRRRFRKATAVRDGTKFAASGETTERYRKTTGRTRGGSTGQSTSKRGAVKDRHGENSKTFERDLEENKQVQYTRKNAQLVFAYWQALTCTVELASLDTVLDRPVHECWNRLFMAFPTWLFLHISPTFRLEQRCCNYHDKSTAMFMHDRTCCQGMMK